MPEDLKACAIIISIQEALLTLFNLIRKMIEKAIWDTEEKAKCAGSAAGDAEIERIAMFGTNVLGCCGSGCFKDRTACIQK